MDEFCILFKPGTHDHPHHKTAYGQPTRIYQATEFSLD